MQHSISRYLIFFLTLPCDFSMHLEMYLWMNKNLIVFCICALVSCFFQTNYFPQIHGRRTPSPMVPECNKDMTLSETAFSPLFAQLDLTYLFHTRWPCFVLFYIILYHKCAWYKQWKQTSLRWIITSERSKELNEGSGQQVRLQVGMKHSSLLGTLCHKESLEA